MPLPRTMLQERSVWLTCRLVREYRASSPDLRFNDVRIGCCFLVACVHMHVLGDERSESPECASCLKPAMRTDWDLDQLYHDSQCSSRTIDEPDSCLPGTILRLSGAEWMGRRSSYSYIFSLWSNFAGKTTALSLSAEYLQIVKVSLFHSWKLFSLDNIWRLRLLAGLLKRGHVKSGWLLSED